MPPSVFFCILLWPPCRRRALLGAKSTTRRLTPFGLTGFILTLVARCSTSAPGLCYVGDDPWADSDDDSCWLDANFTFVARDRYIVLAASSSTVLLVPFC